MRKSFRNFGRGFTQGFLQGSLAYLREFHRDFMRLKKWLCREDFGVLGTIKREVSCRRKPQSPSPYTSRGGGGDEGGGGGLLFKSDRGNHRLVSILYVSKSQGVTVQFRTKDVEPVSILFMSM